jgi:hypothetical protein
MPDVPDSATVKTRLRSLPPAAGLLWIRRGVHTFWRRPLGFVGLWLFFTLALLLIAFFAAVLSPLAMLAIAACLPLLGVGFMQATSDVLNDLKLRPAVFSAPLAGPPAGRRAMLAIMSVYVLALAVLVTCANAMDGGATRHWLQAATTPGPDGKPPGLAPPTEAVLSAIQFVTLGMAVVSLPLWYAPALVHWGRQGALQSVFSSVVAIWRTKGAFFTFLAGWFVIGVLFNLLVQLLAALFGAQAVGLAALTGQMILSITWFVSLWFGFNETFEIRPATD